MGSGVERDRKSAGCSYCNVGAGEELFLPRQEAETRGSSCCNRQGVAGRLPVGLSTKAGHERVHLAQLGTGRKDALA